MYVAQESRSIATLPIVAVGLLLTHNEWGIGILPGALLLIIMALPLFIRYKARIDCGMVHYEVFFLKWTVRRKILAPENIEVIRFKRYDWCKKGAIIQMKDGKRTRLVHFQSNELMERLELFASTYKVELTKSNDYQLLERMDASKKRPSY